MTAFEGDTVRPLGLVTLCAAYAEGELHELIEALSHPGEFDNTKRRWTVGRKLSLAIRMAQDFEENDLAELIETLKEGKRLFERRNKLIHGMLFQKDRLVSNLKDVPEEIMNAEQITALAEALQNWKSQLWAHRCRQVVPYKNRPPTGGT